MHKTFLYYKEEKDEEERKKRKKRLAIRDKINQSPYEEAYYRLIPY